jgi:hypothetical protein
MDIFQFAEKHRLKVSKDDCGDLAIQGRLSRDASISEYGEGHLAMSFLTDGRCTPRTALFNTVRKGCLAAGMTLRQEGDAEGVFVFNPHDPVQARLAIRSIKARAKRIMTPKALENLAAARARAGHLKTLSKSSATEARMGVNFDH